MFGPCDLAFSHGQPHTGMHGWTSWLSWVMLETVNSFVCEHMPGYRSQNMRYLPYAAGYDLLWKKQPGADLHPCKNTGWPWGTEAITERRQMDSCGLISGCTGDTLIKGLEQMAMMYDKYVK